jgi:hypothetical protein
VELDQLNGLPEGIIVFAFLFSVIWSSGVCQVNDFFDARILRWYIDLVAFQIEAFFIAVQLCMAISGALDYLICLGACIIDGSSQPIPGQLAWTLDWCSGIFMVFI